jgi:hypothetical protein
MRLSLPSSATAVFTASLQFNNNIKSLSASVFETTTLRYDQRGMENFYLSEECSFVDHKQSNGNGESDVGILCDPERVCVRDYSSSLGGRCALRLSYSSEQLGNVSEINGISGYLDAKVHLSAEERGLQTCEKCVGTDACKGLDQNFIDTKIGCGSCRGKQACEGITGKYRRHLHMLLTLYF